MGINFFRRNRSLKNTNLIKKEWELELNQNILNGIGID